MTGQIALLLLILFVTSVLLAFEWVTADVIALGTLITLILTGLLPAEEAFAGFGSETFIFLLGLFIMSAALTRTGVVEMTGRLIVRHTSENPNHLLAVVMVASSGLSAFLSNTAATAFFLPLVLGLSRRLRTSASKLLLPLAFASILTSSVTLVSTSTNIVVNALLTQYGMEPMGMFELTPVGLPIAIAGLLYVYFIGRRLLPDRTNDAPDLDALGNYPYLTEVIIVPDSPLAGKSLEESGLGKDLDLNVLRIVRNKSRYMAPRARTRLETGDVLLVEGTRDDLLKVKDVAGLEFKADYKLQEEARVVAQREVADETQAETADNAVLNGGTMPASNGAVAPPAPAEDPVQELQLIELLIPPQSSLINRTLRGSQFRERYGVQVLAINRHDRSIRRKLSQVSLKMGDVLLVQGKPEDLAQLEVENSTFRILGTVKNERPNWKRAPLAIAIFLGTLAAATFNLLTFPVAVLLGAALVFVTRCITPEEAYREVQWSALILIGSMLAIGVAMDRTGAAAYIASEIVTLMGDASPFWLLTAFFVLTVLLTQPMSNQAAAVVVVPVAITTAVQLGLNPRAFAMTIALAASCSYLTPLEPSCLMVYGPGRYKFSDFLRVGSLLTFIIYIITMIGVPLVWPLNA